MKYIEIYKLQNDGSQQVIATCKLVENQVVCEGDEKFVGFLKSGIINYDNPQGKKLHEIDGLIFLEQLKFNFKSGYLNASEVKEV